MDYARRQGGVAGESAKVHLCHEESLLGWAQRASHPSDIVMTPEQLHKRNCRLALSRRTRPRSSLRFCAPLDIASEILSATGRGDIEVLDRTDRLQLTQAILAESPEVADPLTTVYGSPVDRVEAIETARQELCLLTGQKDERYDLLEDICESLSEAPAAETLCHCAGIRALESQLSERVEAYTSESAIFEAAARALIETEGTSWTKAYPGIERVHLAGVSTLGTPILDFLDAVATEAEVAVHYYLRAGTGPRIARRLGTRLGHAGERESPANVSTTDRATAYQSVETTELAVETKYDEARTAAAVFERLLRDDIPVEDIMIVARDIDTYERPLQQALMHYGRVPAFWTQLNVKRTQPYRLVVAICNLLAASAANEIDVDTLVEPLELQWTDPRCGYERPPEPSRVMELYRTVATGPASATSWQSTLETIDIDDEATRQAAVGLLEWALERPDEPTPDDVVNVLEPVVDTFDTRVLQHRGEFDGSAFPDLARTARAVERVAGDDDGDHLLREARAKYADWLDRGHVKASWGAVLKILDVIATNRPGRREHANVERVDVLDATDTWLRTCPYVLAMGFADGEWPQQPHGELPVELRATIASGATPTARQFPVRGAWSVAREIDHFVDALRTPTSHFFVTRFTQDVDGISYERSPLLSAIDTVQASDESIRKLRSAAGEFPGNGETADASYQSSQTGGTE